MERGQFTFYSSFADAAKKIKNKAARADFYDAICEYALHEQEPDMSRIADAAALGFTLVKPVLDTGRRKAKSGQRGGSEKQEQNASKPEANRKQEQTESKGNSEANPKQYRDRDRERERDRYRDISKEKEKEKEKTRFAPPTLEEVTAYCLERDSPVDPKQFWEYFNLGHWIDSRGQQVHNWKQKLLTWEKMGYGSRSDPANAKAGAEKTFDIKYDVE
jgi:hypothetical protein